MMSWRFSSYAFEQITWREMESGPNTRNTHKPQNKQMSQGWNVPILLHIGLNFSWNVIEYCLEDDENILNCGVLVVHR